MGYAAVIASSIAAIGAVVNTVLSIVLRRFMTPPSGGTAGEIIEKAHHAAEAGAAGMTAITRKIDGGALRPAKEAPGDAAPDASVGS